MFRDWHSFARTWLFVLLIVAVAVTGPIPSPFVAQAATFPALPRVYLDTTYTPPTGRTIAVPAGGDFQAALNAAAPGDVITLQAGATFLGPFTLPTKPGSGWIIVRTSAPDSSLPLPGRRISPASTAVMPKIVVGASMGGAVRTASGAHHFRFIGVEVMPLPGAYVYSLIELGAGETSLASLPNNFIFDRCYIHGDPVAGGRRGIAMNAASTAVIDSYVADFKEVGNDTQALMSWNGPGPFKIVNNYLEGAGENVLFGGSDSTIPNLVPSDIEVRGNYFFKPLSWRVGDPAYTGTPWTVKNSFELKNAARVLIDGNIFEYNWVGADQKGFAIVFTPRNQTGTAPWSTVTDVTFTHNIVRHATAGVNFLGWDYTYPSGQLQRVLIQNNLFLDIGGAVWGLGRLFQFVDGTADVTIDHNTAFQTENLITAAVAVPSRATHTGFSFTNTITPHNLYGIAGDGTFGSPLLTLTTYFPGSVLGRNALPGGTASSYPPDNFFPATLTQVGFVNLATGDYHLAITSPYKNVGTDGKDLGADIDALNTATANAVSAPPTLSVAPQTAVDFGAVAIGTSVDQSLTVTNSGGRVLTGTASSTAPFTVASGGPFSLAAGGSQTVVVRFTPTAAGSFAGTITISSNGGGASGALVGTGTVLGVSGTNVASITTNSAAITWTTNQPADSQVDYGLTSAYGSVTSLDPTLVTAHVQTLTGLTPGALYHYRVRSKNAGGSAVSGDSTFTTPPAPPSISLTAPSAGQTVVGTIPVSAGASSIVGIAGVQFMVDGTNLGSEVTAAPYTASWNTASTVNGPHALTAVARDTRGIVTTSSAVTVTVSNITSVSVSPTTLAFGSVPVGTTSAAQRVSITNTGSVGASVSSVSVTGPFAISQNYCLATISWNGVLAPGTHCDVYVVFAPTVASTVSETLSVSAAGSLAPVTLAGTGVSTATAVSVSPTTLAFGSAFVGTTSTAQRVSITNTGSVGASVSSVSVTGPFAISQNYCLATISWNGVLAPGTHCDVYVVFAPTVASTVSETLSVSAAGSLAPVTLAGTGVSTATAVSVSPTSLAFGSVTVGTISAAQRIAVINTGSVATSVGRVSVTGPFVISQNSCLATATWNGVLAPGGHCDVYVAFAPTVASTVGETLSVSAGSLASATLAGTGVSTATAVSVSPTSLAFGSVPVGTISAAQRIAVINTGSVAASVGSVSVTGPFAISQNSCLATATWNGVLAPGGHCDVYVVFVPVVVNSASGTLSISVAGSVYPVLLNGAGL
jgi:hypothetical protein